MDQKKGKRKTLHIKPISKAGRSTPNSLSLWLSFYFKLLIEVQISKISRLTQYATLNATYRYIGWKISKN